MKIKKIAIVLRPKTDFSKSTFLDSLITWLTDREIGIYVLKQDEEIIKRYPNEIEIIDKDDIYSSSDLIITLGGDGTLIGVARKCNEFSPPIFGVNMGKLGFITEFSEDEVFTNLTEVFGENFFVKKIGLFKTKISNAKSSFFINDAVINKSNIRRMFSLSIEVNGEEISTISGDGLIVASTLGSTAYSLAAGGPIIESLVEAMVLTPICPHGLFHRPLVIAENSIVNIKIAPGEEGVALTLDGQEVIDLTDKSQITIHRVKSRYAKIVYNPKIDYFKNLRRKLGHGR